MASLVADYGSDDDIYSDSDSIIGCTTAELDSVPDTKAEEFNSSSVVLQSETTNNDSSSDSDSVSEDSDSQNTNCASDEKLPNPLLGDVSTSSVFINPFKKAELEKQSVLEKHVQMTEKKFSDRKTCFKFKKGNCNRGKHCRFSHDIDTLRGANYYADPEDNFNPHLTDASHQRFVPELPDDDSYLSNKKHRKRIGVTDTLVPPKKAMLALQGQRKHERPWTVDHKT